MNFPFLRWGGSNARIRSLGIPVEHSAPLGEEQSSASSWAAGRSSCGEGAAKDLEIFDAVEEALKSGKIPMSQSAIDGILNPLIAASRDASRHFRGDGAWRDWRRLGEAGPANDENVRREPASPSLRGVHGAWLWRCRVLS